MNHAVRRRGLVLAAVCLAVFAINVDTTIVNVALPSLTRQLGASTRDLQWIVDAYNLAFAALVLAAGSLGDRFGRRPALLYGLALPWRAPPVRCAPRRASSSSRAWRWAPALR